MPEIRLNPLRNAEKPPVSAPDFAPIVRRRRLPLVAIATALLALVALALFVTIAAGS